MENEPETKPYIVRLEIELDAISPEEAAKIAHAIVTNSQHKDLIGPTLFWSYEVQDYMTDESVVIDLDYSGNISETD